MSQFVAMLRTVMSSLPILHLIILLLIFVNDSLAGRHLHKLKRTSGDGMEYLDTDFTCRMQPNGYLCNAKFKYRIKYYYDVKWEGCKQFLYGGCRSHAMNLYDSLHDCKQSCENIEPIPEENYANLSSAIICVLQPEFGECQDYQPSWYFDVTRRTCVGFSYSGCAGNPNRFPTDKACNEHCSSRVFADKEPEYVRSKKEKDIFQLLAEEKKRRG